MALLLLLLPVLLSVSVSVSAQEVPSGGFSLHPPYFNLAEGTKITATATCGEDEAGRSLHDLYCKLVGGPVSGDPGQTIQGQYCDTCSHGDSDRAHPITNAVDGTERWWQSPPLSRSTDFNQVNVTLDLGQLFHVAYVLIKFANSPRPDLWVLERSLDFGQTYKPWQYFASSKRDCIERFGQRTIERISNDDDVVCTSEYSRIVPLENGEVVVSLVNGRPGAMNFSYSPVLRDFTKATHIRLRFLRTNTLLGHLMGKALRDPTVTRRYYYSIKDISIGGRCVCNGHAEACSAQDHSDPYRLQCDCQHNTCGVSCDQCCPGYHQLPWKPATTDSAHECEPCHCHRHSFDCFYDPDVARSGGSVDIRGQKRGGGVCLNCQHHTTGVNCERCVPGHYRAPHAPLDSPLACAPCDCPSPVFDGTCEDVTARCFCKDNYGGDDCDQCASGFINFPQCYPVPTYPSNNNNNNGEAKPAGEIINCECSAAGTVDNSCRPDPQSRTCVCKPGFSGDHCDTCAPGFHGLNCQACQCSGPGCLDGSCDVLTGHGVCRSGFHGYQCEQCAAGYFNYPLCQLCGCSSVGSLPDVCDASGRCLCKSQFHGPRCEQCRSGFYSYPDCQECTCDARTSSDTSCTASGQCHCRPNYSGASCDQCAPGYYGYPSCTPCQCSTEGSRYSSCDHVTGQCACLHNVHGLRCDSCARGTYGFPNCRAGTCHPAGSVHYEVPPPLGQCECRDNVEGVACDRCKPLYWNLSPDSPEGCSTCQCHLAGTLSGVAECAQESGQCHCKPNACSGTCSICKDGFYHLQDSSFLGCQGCQCDIGGSVAQSCHEGSGRCHCRDNVLGHKCNIPAADHYFPDLHHLKFELEEGTMLDGRPVRFGYDLLEFPGFSWRGYAQMSPIQSAVHLHVHVSEADVYLTRVIIRYFNSQGVTAKGLITAYQAGRQGSEQSKQIIFAPSVEPTFVNVPQNNFVEPFVLNPGAWVVVIEAEGILLDYLVLLPSAHYEAPILQLHVTEPCTYTSSMHHSRHNCLLYKYLSLDTFPSISGTGARCRHDNHLPRLCPTERVTPLHPDMAVCSGQDIGVEMRVHVTSADLYVLVVEYASEEESPQTLSVTFSSPADTTHLHTVTFTPCKFSFLCRVVAVDDNKRVAVFSLPAHTELQLSAERANFFLHKIYLVPQDHFSMEYVDPQVLCISTHGQFSQDSSSCVPSRFQTPSDSLVLKDGQQEPVSAAAPPLPLPQGEHPGRVRLDSLQNAAVYSTRVHTLGRYVFILHYQQPLHPTYPVQVYVNGGRIWQGHANASFCPHAHGCRQVLVAENQIILDVTDHQLILTVQVPAGKTLLLDYVLVVPESSYTSSYLSEERLDKSYDFITNCGQNSFFINPTSASPFCLSSATSLSAFFNNGALPCACHQVGAESDACEPFGGQCRCRPHVIGRDCSMCATGYWGFPRCRPCNCGDRLCEPVSGECICPPRTLPPECNRCEPHTFGCHPVVGCEVCNCSRPGIVTPDVNCDTLSGQCRCKNNVVGRQCDRCASGFYGYPNCRPCDCNEAGTEERVCDSYTGQCLCKENVQGSRCDRCRVGTFHLDPTNPKGCTSCFCFGATDRCRSSEKRRTEIMKMSGWVLLSADKQEVAVSVYPGQDLVEADLSDVPDVYQDLHWFAPAAYLGDKVSSYGGHLRYRLHTQTMRGDVWSVPAEPSRPDIILKGNQMTLVFMEREYSSPEEPHLGIVHIVEGSFRHAQTGNSVSREELMMVLVALDSLQIRALHSQSAHSASLRGAVLEGAQSLPAGRHANNVEICMCPANYLGDSCQECAPGYYRDTIGLFLGKCLPCNCNGHSDLCSHGTGVCVSCQHNTAGDHCEKCQGGFLGNNSVDGQACSSCPCPLRVPSNNFADGCVQKNERLQCLCTVGYAGPHCERCAPGYYGNPMVLGSTCQPCHCHGNTDPNMLFTDCHPLTGECLSCMRDTAGPRCDVCAPGYYGDAIAAKNCTECRCSQCGTESCDPHTGQCRCKAGVTGLLCDRCQGGSFGFQSCAGCRPCDCEASAALVKPCDPQSGQCACQPGVNGPSCRQCAPGYWNYGPEGCRKCHCRGRHCDPRTGECRCPHGMEGKQCDACSDQHSVLITHGQDTHCQTCDSCVVVLLEDVDKMNQDFDAVAAQLHNLNASAMAWTQLRKLNASVEDLARAVGSYNSSLDASRNGADVLEGEIVNISGDVDALKDKTTAMAERLADLHDSTAHTHQRAQDLLSSIHNLTMDLNDILRTANGSLNNTEAEQDEGERERKMGQVAAMLDQMRNRTFAGQKATAGREKTEAEKLLERVDKNLARRQQQNQDKGQAMKERLSGVYSDMMDLRDALNQAVNDTARAAELNNANEKTLEDNKRRLDQLKSKHKDVEEQLHMAEDDVAHVNELLATLQDYKEEYERLAAQLDGARTPLAKKVEDSAWADSKIPLVEEAERHAEMLHSLAMNLSSFVEETKGEGLVDVTKAYNKIINSIKAAEDAAREADQAATHALENIQDQDLGQKAHSLRNHSVALKEEVETLSWELNQELNPQLEDAGRRLQDAKTKQAQVAQDLQTVHHNLNLTSNVSQEVGEAKRAAGGANASAWQVSDALRPIREQLEQWQQTYGDANTTSQEVNNALMEANKTVGMLDDAIPLLMKKLDKLHNHSAQMPNISENIRRIRQLIQQARNAASKVSVPVKFNGASGVQVRTPPNLADLAAYTSLKLYVTLPEAARSRRQDDGTKQFVFYLGNKDSHKEFLGMALEGKRLRWYFNIGGETAELLMSEDVKSNGDFNSVVLERILQYGQMSMSSDSSDGDQRVTKAHVEARGDQGLLNLLTDDTVFYVGGYPRTFNPPAPLALPNFKGCIELDTLNEEVLSLYNFENIFQLNTTEEKPCGRSKPALTQAWVNDAAYFDGTGFSEVTFSDESARMQRFEQEVKLVSHNGILLLLQNGNQFLCLAVVRGQLKVYFQFSGEMEEFQPKEPDSPLLRVSDADPKVLEIIILRSPPNRVVVRNNRIPLYTHHFAESIPPFGGSYFLGGVPETEMPERLRSMFPKQGSLKGCFRNVKAQTSHIDLKRMKSSGVSFGCDGDLLVARQAHFSGQSYLDLSLSNIPTLRNNFYFSFSFTSQKKDGLMFLHQDKEGVCQVFLQEGHLVVRAGNSQVRSEKTYHDDNIHYVAVYNNNNGMRVYLDEVLEKSKEGVRMEVRGSVSAASLEGRTLLGGSPHHNINNMTGCISNVFIRRTVSPQMVANLLKVKENVNVPLDCPAANKPQQIVAPPKHGGKSKGKQKKSRSRHTRQSCQGALMEQEVGATYFSGATLSYQRYDSLPASLSSKPHLSLAVRVNSSSGLILYAASAQGGAAMTLSVQEGHLLLSLGGRRKVSLRGRAAIDDQRWHTVFIKRDADKMSLVVDGVNAQSKRVPASVRVRLMGPLYIGGLPPSLAVGHLTTPTSSPHHLHTPLLQTAATSGFIGCVRDLTLNKAPAGSPAHSQGAVPCFRKPLQPGAYFTGEGGHVVVGELLALGHDLELRLEVRPASDSGLLLHAGTSSNQRLSLVMSRGEVMLSVRGAKGDFSLSLAPEEALCDGRWHAITVVKKSNVLQLHVDAARQLGTGPKHGRSAGAKEVVYVGGLPDGVTVSPSVPAFHGCVRHVSVNGRPAPLDKALSVHGAVGTHGCPSA
ncbi:laminin subunit alpha-5 isoform X2 [Nerophis lumbriciformis]|uniref:laminin subunit alpha-5 isoform X2 n=1 Tax=Nerophis lumbriciformis TaxID=546530 RepID=UPI002AE04C70|nr:laminin subunit alpha-5-like isoform X2 [Nerophis lumbriciformis]